MKTINLKTNSSLDITIELGDEDTDLPGAYENGSITSEMNLPITEDMNEDEKKDVETYNERIEVLEKFILNAAIAGVDVESLAFLEAIEATFEFVNYAYFGCGGCAG